MRPGDIYPETGNRLPPVDRAALDPAGQAAYDAAAGDPRSLAGLKGPAGITLHSPRLKVLHSELNAWLRFESGIDARLRELAILVTARELEAEFEWHAHESAAKREGLEAEIVEIVRRRKRPRGIGAKEAAIIKLGREAVGRHRVRRSTYAEAIALFGPEMLVNIVSLMSNYAGTAVLLAAFAQQIPEGSSGTTS